MNITTITVLENSPPYAPPKPDKVHSCASSRLSLRRWAIQLPAPPPRAPRAFSGPRLAPPISDTAETTVIPGTNRGSTCPSCRSGIRPGISSGRRVRRRNSPTTTPAPAVTATHHHCPPNQPGFGIGIPAAPEPDHSHEHQTGERAEHPQGHRIPHEHPELPILSERR